MSVARTETETGDDRRLAEPVTEAVAPVAIEQRAVRAWESVLRARALIVREVERRLAEAGLPPLAWYDVLFSLHRAPERRLRQHELADAIVLSRSGLSRLVDRMEEAGAIERFACPKDRRGQHVQPTEAGTELMRRMWPVYAAALQEHFAPALGDDAETVGASLDGVVESVESVCRRLAAEREAEAP